MHEAEDSQLAQALGLKSSPGLYYEGFVDNLENTLETHRRCTLTGTTYGTRTLKKPPAPTTLPTGTVIDKENDGYLANKQVRMNSNKYSSCQKYAIINAMPHSVNTSVKPETILGPKWPIF